MTDDFDQMREDIKAETGKPTVLDTAGLTAARQPGEAQLARVKIAFAAIVKEMQGSAPRLEGALNRAQQMLTLYRKGPTRVTDKERRNVERMTRNGWSKFNAAKKENKDVATGTGLRDDGA